MTETKIETKTETTEGAVTKALGTQLFILKAIFVAVLAVAVMSVATAWRRRQRTSAPSRGSAR